MTAQPLLDVQDLTVEFTTRRGIVKAVQHVDLTIAKGETVGIVGESGSGKSTTGRAIMGLVPPPGRIEADELRLGGDDLLRLDERGFRRLRGKLVFESPDIEQAWRSAIDPQQSFDWERWRVTWSRDLGLMSPPSGSTLGFGYDVLTTDAMRRVMMPGIHWQRTILLIPHWSIVLLMGIGPGMWLYRRQRVRRTRVSKGLCRRCGFEMGNLYHSCPQCGERAPLPEGFQVIETR